MANEGSARRYAQAAFEIALESNAIPAWRAGLADVAELLVDSAAASTLADSRLPLNQRLRVVDRALDGDPLVVNMAKVLVSHGRSLKARDVEKAFNDLADAHESIAHAEVTTAVELGAGELEAIEQKLSASTGRSVKATSTIDPSIIGGVVIKVGDRLLDASVRTRLRLMRRQLEGVR